ncbi:MAG: caspase family protein [Chloroflexota bacterium]
MSQQFKHGYAVIIGVDASQVSRLALPDVAKDVKALHEVLTHPERCAYQPENVKLLLGEESTKVKILKALYWLQDKVEADPEATAVIYYSGHGMEDKNANQYYLIPYDIGQLRRVRANALKAEELTAEISAIQAKRMLIILDCCHAAGIGVKDVDSRSPQLDSVAFPIDLPETKDVPAYAPNGKDVALLATGEGRAILNSSTGAQSSYVRKDGKMSLFTYHLIEALTGHAPHEEGDRQVLVTDVMSYVTRHVAKTAQTENVTQTPVMRTSGVFPLALLLGGKGLAKGASAPDPLAQLEAVPAGGMQAGGDIVLGDKVGRDKISVGDVSGSGNAIGAGASVTNNTNETINLSGNFAGSNVNVKANLQNVTQAITTLPQTNDDDKRELARLVDQLNQLLQQAPPEKQEQANEVAATTEQFMKWASADNPNKTMIQAVGEGLKQAAQDLKAYLPQIVEVTTGIVTAVLKTVG